MNSFLQYIDTNPLEDLKKFSGKFISIGLCGKYPERFEEYIRDLETNCYDTKNFEVNIAVPDSESVFQAISKVIESTPIEVRIIKLPYEYINAIKSLNIMIKELSDQNTYFYIVNSDRCRFSSKNWDLIIKQYIGSVPDDIFFLRGSNFSKNMKIRKSAQDAFYFPEQNSGVYTRKYLQAIDGFLEFHTAHDGATEMIQYFVSKNKKDPFQRDILMPNIMHSDIRTITSKDTTGGKDRFYERYYINNFFYKRYFSKKGLDICKKASESIYLRHIIWKNKYEDALVVKKGNILAIQLSDKKLINKITYKLNFFEFFKEKLSYFYGVNHGFNFVHRFYFIIKYNLGFILMRNIIFFFNKHIQNVKNFKDPNSGILISYFYTYLSKLITGIFLTEPVSNELEGLFRGDDFKKVLHGKKIKKAYSEKLYKKSLEEIAKDFEKSRNY